MTTTFQRGALLAAGVLLAVTVVPKLGAPRPTTTAPQTATGTTAQGPRVLPAPRPRPKRRRPVGPPTGTTTTTTAPQPLIEYTVRPGDTLTGIAHWFKENGYGPLFTANEKVIGSNPNLIHPGQVLAIWPNGKMTSTTAVTS